MCLDYPPKKKVDGIASVFTNVQEPTEFKIGSNSYKNRTPSPLLNPIPPSFGLPPGPWQPHRPRQTFSWRNILMSPPDDNQLAQPKETQNWMPLVVHSVMGTTLLPASDPKLTKLSQEFLP